MPAQHFGCFRGAGHRLLAACHAPEHALTTKQELAKIPILDALWEDLLKRLRQTDADLFLTENDRQTQDRRLA